MKVPRVMLRTVGSLDFQKGLEVYRSFWVVELFLNPLQPVKDLRVMTPFNSSSESNSDK